MRIFVHIRFNLIRLYSLMFTMMLFEHRVSHPDVPDRENKAGKSQISANNLEVCRKFYSDFCVLLQILVFFRFLQFLISWPHYLLPSVAMNLKLKIKSSKFWQPSLIRLFIFRFLFVILIFDF